MARYVCGACLYLVAGVPPLDLALCAECGGEMVQVLDSHEALADLWSDTHPGVSRIDDAAWLRGNREARKVLVTPSNLAQFEPSPEPFPPGGV